MPVAHVQLKQREPLQARQRACLDVVYVGCNAQLAELWQAANVSEVYWPRCTPRDAALETQLPELW